MVKARWTWLAVAALAGVVGGVAGCDDDGNGGGGNTTPDAGSPTAGTEPGFGKDRRQPKGTPLTVPAGLEIVSGPLVGADDDGNCGEDQLEPVGSGFMVRACMEVTNTSGGPLTMEFPPGLVIVSRAESHQNGILVERTVVTVPPTPPGPGGNVDGGSPAPVPVKIPLHLYCINMDSSPSDPDARYTLGPVTNHPKMKEVFDLMEDKDIAGDGERVEILQKAIYSITEDDGLTEDDREAIRDL